MFSNYLKIAFRILSRQKVFTAINILGLATGMATCLLILLFVVNELSYDRFNRKADRMVRVVFRGSIQGEKMREASVMPPVARTLADDYPEVEEATRVRDYGHPRLLLGNQYFDHDRFAYVDSNFFDVFTLPFLLGNSRTALTQPFSLVITESAAKRYFGKENPLGKVLRFEGWEAGYKITGLIKDLPSHAHFHFDLFASMASLPEARVPSWMVSNFYTYLVLPEGYDYRKLQAKLPQVVDKYIGPQLRQAMGMSLSQFKGKGNDIGLFLQPLTDIHLRSDLMFELEPGGDIRYVYIFGVVAVFMLLIACINFINLSTAGATKRAREVGIRKVLGSEKKQLVVQFLFESLLLTAIALLLAIPLVQAALPLFNELTGKELSLDPDNSHRMIFILLLFGLVVGIVAGSYPAFYLSSFKPVSVLKGRPTQGRREFSLRSGLVVFQFFISITLVICTVVVYRQLSYIRNKELGYNKDQVLVLPETWKLGRNEQAFRNQILEDPRVLRVSTSYYLPAGISNYNNYMVFPDDHPEQLIKTLRYEVDDQYIPTLGMKLAAGRNFQTGMASDSGSVILNEAAVREFGWGRNPLGHILTHKDNEGITGSLRVIGVVKDFHFKSLHEHISPLLMVRGDGSGSIIVKAETADMRGLLSTMEKLWRSLAPSEAFYYSFLDDRFNEAYLMEQKAGRILGIFAALTILVACLGLFGLAMFTAEQRTKEIGIRKVLGASVQGIAALLSLNFLKLVGIALLLASPLAWWAMNLWLRDFAYRIRMDWWIFILAGVLAVLIALVTVGYHAIRSALANPVKSLRSE